jgi:DNA adenine methylase
MTDEQHRELAEVLHHVQGKVAISSYSCPLMDELYDDWNMVKGPEKLVHSVKEPRQEVLYVNYDLGEFGQWTQTGSKVKRPKPSSKDFTSEPLLI